MKKHTKSELEKNCSVCENASFISDEDHMLCKKYGIVSKGYACRKFIYDPLKYIPTPVIPMPEYEPVLLEDQ